ncbi:MAG: hypothetical protein ACTHKG_10265 [Nocardioides sp.]
MTADLDAQFEQTALERRTRHEYWAYLGLDNLPHVAERIHNLLDGRRFSAVARVYRGRDDQFAHPPQIITGLHVEQGLEDAIIELAQPHAGHPDFPDEWRR